MQKKTYCRPEIQTITMLNEGMIAVSGKPNLNNPVGGLNESDPKGRGQQLYLGINKTNFFRLLFCVFPCR